MEIVGAMLRILSSAGKQTNGVTFQAGRPSSRKSLGGRGHMTRRGVAITHTEINKRTPGAAGGAGRA